MRNMFWQRSQLLYPLVSLRYLQSVLSSHCHKEIISQNKNVKGREIELKSGFHWLLQIKSFFTDQNLKMVEKALSLHDKEYPTPRKQLTHLVLEFNLKIKKESYVMIINKFLQSSPFPLKYFGKMTVTLTLQLSTRLKQNIIPMTPGEKCSHYPLPLCSFKFSYH